MDKATPEEIVLQLQIVGLYAAGLTSEKVKTALEIDQEVLDRNLTNLFKITQSSLTLESPDGNGTPRTLAGSKNKQRAVLSEREREAIVYVGQGLKNKEMADYDHMGISEQTVKNHIHNVFDKLNVEGRLELAIVTNLQGYLVQGEPLEESPDPTTIEMRLHQLPPQAKDFALNLCAGKKDRQVAHDFSLTEGDNFSRCEDALFKRLGVSSREQLVTIYAPYLTTQNRPEHVNGAVKHGLNAHSPNRGVS